MYVINVVSFQLCVRAILPGVTTTNTSAQGVWPAHWMMPDDDSCDPDEGEMDITEMVNGNGKHECTYHWQTTWPNKTCQMPKDHAAVTASAPLPDFNQNFHVSRQIHYLYIYS